MNQHLPFREFHLLRMLEAYDQQQLPIDLFINQYFKENKALGSKDRAFIAERIYGIIRWKGLLDYLSEKPVRWESRVKIYQNSSPGKYLNDPTIPEHIRVSFPKDLYKNIVDNYGEAKAQQICIASNQQAPTTVRINPLKTTREKLFNQWKNDFDISLCQHSPFGIMFHKRVRLFQLPEFREGLFEMQDEGSQLLADLIQAKPGDQVMDYCAGSGGKTLAFAHKLQHSGQIYLHDIRLPVLAEAKKRLRRAGIQNAQIVLPKSIQLRKLRQKMDWVLVDAPCSGTGTLRRNPDMKWKFTTEMLQRLVGQQRQIFEQGLSFLRPGGCIVYGTCSLLKEENEKQIDHFLKTYPLSLESDPFKSLPQEGEMDGFFGVIFQKVDI